MRRFLWLGASVTVCLTALAQQPPQSESGLRHTVGGAVGGRGRPGLIVFLHGTGGNTALWGGWAGAAGARGYVTVIPRSTGTGDAKAGNTSGDNLPRWADVDIPKLVILTKEVQKKHNVDPRRTFICGYSNGGFYSSETALRNPHLFSAAIVIGGGCNVYEINEQTKQVGVYFIHGTKDGSVAYDVAVKASERLKAAGFRDVVLRTYEGRGHELFEEEIPRAFEWLEKQKRRVVPGATKTIPWKEDLAAALQTVEAAKRRVLAYFFSEADGDSDTADFLQMELFPDKGFIEASAAFECVKVDWSKDALARGTLKIKGAALAVLEMQKGKPRIVQKFEAGYPVESVVARLRQLAPRKK